MLSYARLGRTLWRTYGARGLGRRAVHEARRAAGAFRAAPGWRADAPDGVFGPVGAKPYAPAAGALAALDGAVSAEIVARAERVVRGQYQAFGHEWRDFPADPDAWATAPRAGFRFPGNAWWAVPHLPAAADIKDVWEPARFGWAYDLARAQHLAPDPAYAATFHRRLAEWAAASPPFRGVHWSCGQEAAIRALAILHAEAALPAPDGADAGLPGRVLAWSGERIADAIGYGLSQRNNHGISEAAGLVHLGLRLAGHHPRAARWLARGRRLLGEQVMDQVAADGWYAQHSFVYMRVALAQALAAERALRAAGLTLGPGPLARLGASAELMAQLADGGSGGVPNFGANDGSNVLPLATAPYHDFRPVLTLAAAVLARPLPAAVAPDAETCAWLGVDLAREPADARMRRSALRVGGDGGWVAAWHGDVRLFLRAGRYRHRPSHMDLLHLSLSRGGTELVADPGTYAYNAPPPWNNGLAGARVHNAPVLDGAEPAARGPRFLWKSWPNGRLVEATRDGEVLRVIAEMPGRVRRTVTVRGTDVADVAVVDVALDDAARTLEVTWLLHPAAAGSVQVDGPDLHEVVARPDAVDGWYSPTYGVRVPTRAVRARAHRPAPGEPLTLTTRLRLAAGAPA